MSTIYLDYAATSLKHFDILKNTINELENIYANPSSNHTLGKKNNKLLNNARKYISQTINAKDSEIIFTSGGTEANNMIFNHILNSYESGEIIISNIEHSSIIECANKLEDKGFKIIKLEVNKDGVISLNHLKKVITENTVLVSIMLANNETGVIQPIDKIADIVKQHNILLHSDIVQAFGKINIDVKKLNLDFASVSAHKIGATNNFGFLYAKDSKITPLIIGGGQENNLRSGTSDVLGAVMLEKCLHRTLNSQKTLEDMKNYFITCLKNHKVSFEINGSNIHSLPNILNIYFKNIEAQRLITFLDANNIFISGGSACSSGSFKGSRIIASMYNDERAEKSVRISIGYYTTKEMIDITVNKIKELENRILMRGK
ncbi:cysteine desulfurase [Gemella sp. GH3]|uniref:cysteine desulfurase family protein n=1 Tax=unclassified Gemella TaxID=2624949 RepID=UPI0015D01DAE|nr:MULTISPECIES: cysteine desulfurase family protein [unclassified Gemella]MBF0713321.1 cysteine desulfurase [Gemella sp. GH3.1]NYS50273.1 cysteine desulfurase [Gemella sp. GH3]